MGGGPKAIEWGWAPHTRVHVRKMSIYTEDFPKEPPQVIFYPNAVFGMGNDFLK